MSPFITVLICNYNYGRWLGEAIDSALNQDYPPDRLKVCVIDDASTDNSVEIAKKRNSDRVILIELEENGGPAKARNAGIEATIGFTDYYLILDADDIAHPNKVQTMVDAIHYPDIVGVVYANYFTIDEKGNKFVEYKEPYSKIRLMTECIVHSGALVKAEALKNVKDEFGYFDEELRVAEDYYTWLKISEYYSMVHVPETLTTVRTHNNNSTNSVKSEIWEQCWSKIREKLSAKRNT